MVVGLLVLQLLEILVEVCLASYYIVMSLLLCPTIADEFWTSYPHTSNWWSLELLLQAHHLR